MTHPAPVTAMTELLDLEVLDRDLYRGHNEVHEGGGALFGGQVAAQGLRAAGLTVPPDRRPHSLHGYFLRPGRPDWPVILQVHRDRDGRSFSARRVEARQHGEVIFSMSASFHVDEASGGYLPPLPVDVPDPLSLPEAHQPWLNEALLELRPVGDVDTWANAQLWARLRTPLGEDPLAHACALAYLSDLGTGFASVEIGDLPLGGPSLDHALWLHTPVRADEWILIDLWPMKAGGARGLYAGAMYDADGRLGAMLTQEVLLRPDRR